MHEMTRHYLVCALWSSTDEHDNPLDANYDIDDIAPESIAQAEEDCLAFLNDNKVDITDLEQAGHDFWLTRNHHGAGFWDRGLGEKGKRLTDASHAYGTQDMYVGDDGKVYLS